MKVRAFVMLDTDIDVTTQKGRDSMFQAIDQAVAVQNGAMIGGIASWKGTPRLAKHDQFVEHGGRTVKVI